MRAQFFEKYRKDWAANCSKRNERAKTISERPTTCAPKYHFQFVQAAKANTRGPQASLRKFRWSEKDFGNVKKQKLHRPLLHVPEGRRPLKTSKSEIDT